MGLGQHLKQRFGLSKSSAGTVAMAMIWIGFMLVVAGHGASARAVFDLLALAAAAVGALLVLLFW